MNMGDFVLYINKGEIKVGKACSYDALKGKYRILPMGAGKHCALRKKELIVSMNELFKKYAPLMKGQER